MKDTVSVHLLVLRLMLLSHLTAPAPTPRNSTYSDSEDNIPLDHQRYHFLILSLVAPSPHSPAPIAQQSRIQSDLWGHPRLSLRPRERHSQGTISFRSPPPPTWPNLIVDASLPDAGPVGPGKKSATPHARRAIAASRQIFNVEVTMCRCTGSPRPVMCRRRPSADRQ